MAFVPIEAEQRVGQSKIKLARDGAKFFLILLKIITIFSPLRIFVPVSVITFALGFVYALRTIWTQSHVTNSSVLLIVLSVVIFLVGLVSEQISALQVRAPAVTWTRAGRQRRLTRTLAAAVAAAFIVRVLFAFVYWVGKPLTHDELEYLEPRPEALPTGTGSPTTRTCRRDSRAGALRPRAALSGLPVDGGARHERRRRSIPAIKVAQAVPRRHGRAGSSALVARRAAGDRAAAWAAWIGGAVPAAGVDVVVHAVRDALHRARLRQRAGVLEAVLDGSDG